MATVGLYGSSSSGVVAAASGSESTGLYGNNVNFGGSYFEWFIFIQSDTQPAIPTGGSWSFTTNSGTPPTGWSTTPFANPTNKIWASIALVNSKNTSSLVWSEPGLFSYASGLPILSGASAPQPTDGQSDQLYIETGTTPETIWFKQAGTWTRLTGSSLYVDLTSNQTIAGTKTFSSTIQGSVSGTSNNVTGIVGIANGGTGSTTASGARTALGAAASGANSDITSLSGITNGISSPDYIQFDVNPTTVPTTPGALYWDAADGNQTLSLVMAGNNAVQQIGEELYYRIKATSAITEGQVVMFTGTVGSSGALTGAPASGLNAFQSEYVMGVATENIATNGWGYVTWFGLVRGINTTGGAEAWTDGQVLYYNPAVAGGLTKNIPTAPNPKVIVASVVKAASNGSLFIRPTFGSAFGSTDSNVQFTALANNNMIQYDAAAAYWKNVAGPAGAIVGTTDTQTLTNKTISGASNTLLNIGNSSLTNSSITINGSTVSLGGSTTVTATATNALTIGTGLSGTSYNGSTAVTIANTGVLSFSGGTTGLTPSTATTGAVTLAGTLAVANGGTGATTAAAALTNLGAYSASNPNGYTSNTGTVTSVAVSGGTTGLTTSGGPVTTSGTITLAGTLGISNGGTGQTTAQAAMNAFAGAVTSGLYLRGNGTNVVMSAIQAADVPTLNQNTTGNAATATTATNVSGGSANVTTLTTSSTVTLNGGTANGVAYLNGSKVLTTGSALTFDGTNFKAQSNIFAWSGGASVSAKVGVDNGTADSGLYYDVGGSLDLRSRTSFPLLLSALGSTYTAFNINSSEQMRLTSTGLGIGTSSISNAKLLVSGSSAGTVGAIMSVDTAGSTSFVRMVGDSSSQNLINWQDGTALRFATSTQAYGTFNERMRLDSSGNLGIGTSSTTSYRLRIKGETADSTKYALLLENSTPANLMFVRNDGVINTGTLTASPYNNTTATAANLVVQSSGELNRSTSAAKYKQDIRDIESIDINLFRPVRYKSKCANDDQTKDHFGLIADEVAEAGIEELVTRGADGEVEGFQYERLTVVLLKAIQEQQAIIAELTARVAQLESK